jgi:hypothetical protein
MYAEGAIFLSHWLAKGGAVLLNILSRLSYPFFASSISAAARMLEKYVPTFSVSPMCPHLLYCPPKSGTRARANLYLMVKHITSQDSFLIRGRSECRKG